MCGIAGIVATDPIVSTDALQAMVSALRHRGPDDEAVWVSPDRRTGLAHTRLAVLDLSSAGRQPMSNEDSSVFLVCNGEIYTYRELRSELQKSHHRFRSQGDAEVILHGYEEWGDRVIDRLSGMFAFAIWDTRRNRLLLARDRLGIKPLFYERTEGLLMFASELSALNDTAPSDRTLDATAVWDYLTYGYVPAPKTPFKSIRKLEPGHLLVLEDGKIRRERYWDVDFGAVRLRKRGDLLEELRTRLQDVVSQHLVSDVPLGCMLSAGVDSSSVTAFARRAAQHMKTYTIGFEGMAWSEAEPAAALARHLGTEHTEAYCSAIDAGEGVAQMPGWFGEPFADTSAVPTALVSRLARQDVTVALSGDGGDEVFGGYRHYQKFLSLRKRDVLPQKFRALAGTALAGRMGAGSKLQRSFYRWAMGDLDRFVTVHGGMTREQKKRWLPPHLIRRFADYDDYWNFRQYWRDDLDAWSRMQYLDMKTYLPDDILTKVDRVSMEVALEVRPPLLDHRLVEFAATIPHDVRSPRGELKGLFKEAVSSLLPDDILARGKQGFSTPSADWLRAGFIPTSERSAGWEPGAQLHWGLLQQWTTERLGVEDPVEVLAATS